MSASLLEQALALAARGLPCFPCRADKSPATPHGFKDATRDPAILRRSWWDSPDTLIGVPTGAMSGYSVLDIDPRHAGDAWLAAHAAELPPTRIHQTRSGGQHLFFRHPEGLRSSVGKIAAGVDVRASGGYVIWWPAAGLPVLSMQPAAEWPDGVMPRRRTRPRGPRAVIPDGHGLTRLVRLVANAEEGERNSLTFWAACRAGEMVASGFLDFEKAVAIITEAAVKAGLPREEAEATARSGVTTTGEKHHA